MKGLGAAAFADYTMGRILRILPAFILFSGTYYFVGTAGIDSVDKLKSVILKVLLHTFGLSRVMLLFRCRHFSLDAWRQRCSQSGVKTCHPG